jgi:hypothetical protein
MSGAGESGRCIPGATIGHCTKSFMDLDIGERTIGKSFANMSLEGRRGGDLI